jgi:hypothetical protein
MTTPEAPKPRLRIRSLKLTNFKAIDHVELEFPPPVMADDPDVFVFGSLNGVGKTSVLEAICLLFFFIQHKSFNRLTGHPSMPDMDFIDNSIRSGADSAMIEAVLEEEFPIHDGGGLKISIHKLIVTIHRNGRVESKFPSPITRMIKEGRDDIEEGYRKILEMFGLSPEPLLVGPIIMFNGFRKVQEGSPELGMLIDDSRSLRWRRREPLSRFSTLKAEILRLLMARGDIFEGSSRVDTKDYLEKLNDIVRNYANGEIAGIKPSGDNTLQIRIRPLTGGESYSFDGLSSGQKEMISMLYLIWKHTLNNPSIVLIDEPELHLHPAWHREIVYQLTKLAPLNQYILASHSDDVFLAVDGEHRAMLRASRSPDRGES